MVLTRGSILMAAPTWVGVLVAVLLFLSLALALFSFSTRRFEIAPDIVSLESELSERDTASSLRAAALPDIIYALQSNEPKVAQKANLLFMSGAVLMLSVATFGGYFIAQLVLVHS